MGWCRSGCGEKSGNLVIEVGYNEGEGDDVEESRDWQIEEGTDKGADDDFEWFNEDKWCEKPV